MWNHRFFWPFDCLGVITATTMLFVSIPVWLKGPTFRNAGKRESPFGSAFGVIIGIYLVWKRGLLQGETFRKQYWKPISFLSLVDKETLSGCCQCTGPIPVTCMCIYIYVYIYMYVYICMYIYICMYVCIYTYIRTYTYIHTYTYWKSGMYVCM